MKILSCNNSKTFVSGVCEMLDIMPLKATIRRFSDMEVFVEIHEHVRGEDVFVVQSTSAPANENLMEMLICIDALRRASAKRITAVLPYFGYARQDRKPGPRTPISAKLVANLISTAGADRVLTIDLHSGQIQGFFDIPLDNLYSQPVFVNKIRATFEDLSNVIVVSPDAGGVTRARAFAKSLNVGLCIIDKRRSAPGISEVMNVIGDVSGKKCLIVDDILDTGGTLCNAAIALMQNGATEVYACITHPVLSSDASSKITKSCLSKVFVGDTIPIPQENKSRKIEVVSVVELIAKAIYRISNEQSISILFEE